MSNARIPVIFDMETSDPDDVVTLCFLTSHPQIELLAVNTMPGTDWQVGLVRTVLRAAGLQIPVGACQPHCPKDSVSNFYRRWLGEFAPEDPDGESSAVIAAVLAERPDAQLLTGAPLKGFRPNADTLCLERWVAQGGFAGDNIVPPQWRLPKFEGRETFATFNFNGDPNTALAMLTNPNIREKYLVSKNVCHGVVYDEAMHERFAAVRTQSAGLELIHRGMGLYLREHPNGKKFHDPLAACALLDRSMFVFAPVQVYRARGEWGCRPDPASQTFISIHADAKRMVEILTTH